MNASPNRGLAEAPTAELGSSVHGGSMQTRALSDGAPGGRSAPTLDGDKIGRFRVRDTLGCGGMGVVLEAYDELLDRTVALKLMHRSESPQQRQRLLLEAKALARLSHPNVVQVYDVVEDNDRTFIAMELVHGQTLRTWAVEQPRTWRETVAVYIQAGRGLAAAHAEGLVHRDFKPENCIIGDGGRVRVLDFGLVRDLVSESHPTPCEAYDDDSYSEGPVLDRHLTRPGAIVGTLAFMPHEQLKGSPATALSDQYSFCASLHEALYGVPPFDGNSPLGLMLAQERGELAKVPDDVRVPRALRRVLLRGLSHEPARRFRSMQGLLQQLRRIVRPRRRGRTAAVMVMGTAIGGGTWGLVMEPPSDPCAPMTEAIQESWNPHQRSTMHDRFVAHQVDTPLGLRVIEQLDGYAAAWSQMARDACEATMVRQEQSPSILERRMGCLERRSNRLQSTVTTLLASESHDQLVQRTQLPFRLPRLEPCADTEELAATRPSTLDSSHDEHIAALRRRIDEAHTLREAGEFTDGLALALTATSEARTLGDPLLVAESLECLGRLQAESAQGSMAEDTLAEAIVQASEARADQVAAKAWLSLLYALTIEGHRERAHARVLAAQAAVARTHDDTLHAWWLNNVGILHGESGQRREAGEAFEAALALKSETLGDDHLDVGIAWLNLGTHRVDLEDHRGAAEAFSNARAIIDTTVGPTHPLAMMVEAGRCQMAAAQRLHHQAVEHCTRAVDFLERSASSPIFEFRMRGWLAKALAGTGQQGLARAAVERALAMEDMEQYRAEVDLLRAWARDHAPSPTSTNRSPARATGRRADR